MPPRSALAAGALALAITAGFAAAPGVASGEPARLAPGDVPGGAIEPEPPGVELVTFGAGESIFERYGHAALCLVYHQREHAPVCFNYGVTNFDAGPALVWNFLRRQQRFWVEPASWDEMYSYYADEDRDIWRQRLPITGDAARALEARLWRDLRKENRYYRYDPFLDNCTTRLRDMIDEATHGALRTGADAPYPLSFRELARRGLADVPWLLAVSDLVTGRPLDDHPTAWEAMFHPDVFRAEVAARLGAAPGLVYRRRGPALAQPGSSGRGEWAALALLLAAPLVVAHRARRARWQTAALALVALELAVLGAIVWGLVIASPIAGLRDNEAVLVVTPLDAALPLLAAAWRRRYAQARVGLVALASLLGAIGVLHQPLWIVILAVFVPMATIALEPPRGPEPPARGHGA